jgi:hypothetical protein
MSPEAVTLETAQQKGYNIHIKGTIDGTDKQIVQDVAKRHNLAVKEEKDQVIVYTPFFTSPPKNARIQLSTFYHISHRHIPQYKKQSAAIF